MKRIKVVMLTVLVSAVTFVACQKDEVPVNSSSQTQVERPWNMISYKEIIERLEDYDKTRKPVLEAALGYEDARINYYSIETLENYIAYVKQLSKEKGIEFTGINFVAGAYPKDGNYGTPGYQHIMFMPTANINGNNIGFDPMLSTNEKIVTIKEMLTSYGYNWVYDSKEDYKNRNIVNRTVLNNFTKRKDIKDINSSSSNFGELRPPEH